jgi:hypothetical protein
MDQWPESLRRRAQELAREDPLERVKEVLGGYFSDAESLAEVEADFSRRASVSTRGVARDLRAFEAVLAAPMDPGVPTRLVALEANWVLAEPTDEKSLEFLRGVADMLRRVLASAPGSTGPPDPSTA